jgi:hypothetical protein
LTEASLSVRLYKCRAAVRSGTYVFDQQNEKKLKEVENIEVSTEAVWRPKLDIITISEHCTRV